MQRVSRGLAAGCLLWTLLCGGVVSADDAVKSFNIPEEDLGAALRDFGRQANQQILFSTDLVLGKRSPRLEGSLTVDAAVAALLAGTDLIATRIADGSLLISRHNAQGTSDSSDPGNAPSAPGQLPPDHAPKSQITAGLEEVIVTSTRRALSVQQIEGGIVPITGELLRDTHAQTLAEIAGAAPGLAFSEMSPTEQVFTIRGVNTSSQVSSLQSPTALYLDEVPVSDPYLSQLTPSFQLFDVRRIEVLLGPQGTLFGAGALGGAVRVVTNKPSLQQFDASIEQSIAFPSVGSLTSITNGMVNVPLISDTLALRLVGTYAADGGYIDNPQLERANYNQIHTVLTRAQLMWQVSPRIVVTGSYSYESDRPNASAYTPYGSRDFVYSSAVTNRSTQVLNIANIVAEYAGDAFTATSSTSYLHRGPNQQTDVTDLASGLTGLSAAAADVIRGYTRNLVQEFRLVSPALQAIRWLGGVYLQKYDIDETETLTQIGAGDVFASSGFPSDTLLNDRYTGYVNEQALYGEVSYDLSSRVAATVGARAFHDSVSITDYGDAMLDGGPNTVSNSASYSGVTPKFVISYRPDKELMYYVQVSEGFRSGQGNLTNGEDPLAGTPIPRFYGPDHLWSYELGAKTSLINGRATLNGDIYDVEWSRIQLQEQSPSGFNFTANAGRAWIRGVDLQASAQVTDAVETGVSFDYHRSRLTEVSSGSTAVAGDELPGSSRLSGYAFGKLKFPLTAGSQGFFRVDYAYSSKAYSDLDNATSLHYGNVGSWGAQLGAHMREYEFLLFGRNLADARNRVNAFELLGVPTQVLQAPRYFGLTFRWTH